MSKVGNALIMLTLLQSRGKMQIEEIAQELGITKRAVRSYKEAFDQARINVNSKSGKYGGYELDQSTFLSNINLNKEECSAFVMGCEYLKNSDFFYSKEFKNAENKIKAAIKNKDNYNVGIEFYKKGVRSSSDYEEERKIWRDINTSIITKSKLEMIYFSLTSGLNKRVVRPYAVFEYNGDRYFIGYCELRNKILEFKFSRIEEYKTINQKFDMPKGFSLKEYMKKSIGIFGGKEFNVKLKIKFPMSRVVSEKIWVENQKIKHVKEDNSIIFEAVMKGMTEIKSWILGMGSNVEVLEPIELKEEIKKEIEKMKNIYNF